MEAEKLKELEILSEETFLTLFELESEVERVDLLNSLEARAKELKVLQAFKRKYNAYLKDNREINKYIPVNRSDIDLELNSRGGYVSSISNFVKILENDNEFKGKIRFNEITNTSEFHGQVWNDTTDSEMRLYIESKYKIHSKEKLNDAIRVVSKKHSYNPLKEIIESITWDGKSRIKTMLSKWLQAEDSEYVQEVSRLIFAGGIHRLYEPGCKFDEMPVLVGTSQGEGKSTFVRLLAMDDKYFNEVKDIEGQKGVEAIQGYWICEMGELLALTRTKEVEAVKVYIACMTDKYRKPYDKHISEVPRTSIIIGTTNNENFLVDKTGNRRFYPVITHSRASRLFESMEELKYDIQQCWAEALHLYKQNAIPAYLDKQLYDVVKLHQENAMYDDYRQGLIEDYLDHRTTTCILQLWHEALGNPLERKPDKKDSLEIGQMVRKLEGWVNTGKRDSIGQYGRQRLFEKLPF